MAFTKILGTAVVLFAALGTAFTVAAQSDDAYVAVTTKDPTVPKERLAIRVTPMTIDELTVEADAWMELVRQNVRKIASTEIAVQFQNQQIQTVKETASALEKASEAAREAEETIADQADPEAAERATQKRLEAQEQLQRASEAAEEAARVSEQAEEDEDVQAAAVDADERAQRNLEADTRATAARAARSDEALESVKRQDATANSNSIEQTAASVQNSVASESQEKTAMLERLNELRDERTGLIDRTRVILNELDRKGGDSSEYRKYLVAVSGIRVDSNDLEGMWATISGWMRSEQGGVRWGLNVLQFFGILIAFLVIGRVAERATRRAMRMSRGTSNLMRDFVSRLVRRVILIIGVILGLSAMEVDIGPLIAVIGAAGFVVAFALQDTLGNFASGILILVYRPFDVGDVVEVSDVSGTVAALNIVSTTIKTFDNKILILPNNTVWQNVITNATGSPTRRVDMVFGIGYEDSVDDAQRILEEIVEHHPLTHSDPEPVIKLHELADSSVNFICRPWCKTGDYWTVYWDITRSVKDRFDAEGISIPYPQSDIHVHNVAATPETSEPT